MKLVLLLALLCSSVHAAHVARQLHKYTFADYTKEFKKSYKAGSTEWNYRKGLFENRLEKVIAQNSIPEKKFKLGVNRFSDMTEEEFHPMRFSQSHAALKGHLLSEEEQWKLLASASPAPTETLPKFTQTASTKESAGNMYRRSHRRSHSKLNKPVAVDWSAWPKEQDWHQKGFMTAVHDQSGGSCWAHTAVEALEASSAIAHDTAPADLSVQEIVACVPNPEKCGGDGGCSGSIVELAFKYVVENGLRRRKDYPMDFEGICTDNVCKTKDRKGGFLQANQTIYEQVYSSSLSLSSWKNLPENKVAPVMEALQRGPVAVAVSTDGWRDYDGGILDTGMRDVVLGHAVLLVGYGEEDGNKFWKIRNSWGFWGEMGYIRLKRQDNPDQYCGTDSNAQAGTACQNDPKVVTVCGTNGILYDPVIVTEIGKI